jgi:hypothetical protein
MTSAKIGTLSIEQIGLTSLSRDSSPDPASDYTITYDASAGSNKKVLLNDLGLGRRYKIASSGNYNNSSPTVETDITDLNFDVKANRTYRAKWYLGVTANATTIGLSYVLKSSAGSITGSSSLTASRFTMHTTSLNTCETSSTEPAVFTTGTYSTTVPSLATREIVFICSADATITLGFRTETGGSSVVYQYSCVEYEQLGSYNI